MNNYSKNEILSLKNKIEKIWNEKESINTSSSTEARNAIEKTLNLLDSGLVRVSEKVDNSWKVNQWLKKAVLLSFKIWPMNVIKGGPDNSSWWDKIPSKFSSWTEKDFKNNNFDTKYLETNINTLLPPKHDELKFIISAVLNEHLTTSRLSSIKQNILSSEKSRRKRSGDAWGTWRKKSRLK